MGALARKSSVGLGMEVSGILDSRMGRRPWDWTGRGMKWMCRRISGLGVGEGLGEF